MNHTATVEYEMTPPFILQGGICQDYCPIDNEVRFFELSDNDEEYNNCIKDHSTVAIWKPKSSRPIDPAWDGAVTASDNA